MLPNTRQSCKNNPLLSVFSLPRFRAWWVRARSLLEGLRWSPEGLRWLQEGPRWLQEGLRWLQDGPSWAKIGSRWPPRWSKMLPGGSKMPQDASKMPQDAPRCLQDAPRCLPDLQVSVDSRCRARWAVWPQALRYVYKYVYLLVDISLYNNIYVWYMKSI